MLVLQSPSGFNTINNVASVAQAVVHYHVLCAGYTRLDRGVFSGPSPLRNVLGEYCTYRSRWLSICHITVWGMGDMSLQTTMLYGRMILCFAARYLLIFASSSAKAADWRLPLWSVKEQNSTRDRNALFTDITMNYVLHILWLRCDIHNHNLFFHSSFSSIFPSWKSS